MLRQSGSVGVGRPWPWRSRDARGGKRWPQNGKRRRPGRRRGAAVPKSAAQGGGGAAFLSRRLQGGGGRHRIYPGPGRRRGQGSLLGHQARRGSGDPREEEGAAAEPRPREEVGPGSEWGRSAPCKLRRSQGGGVGTAAASDPREEERVGHFRKPGLPYLDGDTWEEERCRRSCTGPGRRWAVQKLTCRRRPHRPAPRSSSGGSRDPPDPRRSARSVHAPSV